MAKNIITVKTMKKDKDGKPVEQAVLASHVEGVTVVPAVEEAKATDPKPGPEAVGAPMVPGTPAVEKQPESAIIKMRDGSTLHVAMTAKEVMGMLD